MNRLIVQKQIVRTDPRLGRNQNHDSISRLFAFPTEGLQIVDVFHERHIPIFDQGNLGACVANASNGCRGTGKFYKYLKANTKFPLTADGNLELYRALTRSDPFPGFWESDDTGSDGLTAGKVLTEVGDIPGYLHAFSLEAALKALSDRPLITGTYWYDDMFDPNAEGLVNPTGSIAGGHEFIVDEYRSDRGWVGFTNSWSRNWGLNGRFYLEAEKWETLLNQDGDVTIFSLPVEPPPEPVIVDPDVEFAHVLKPWINKWTPMPSTKKIKKAAKMWLDAKELS